MRPAPADIRPPSAWFTFEQQLERFEQAWQTGQPPKLLTFLPPTAGPERRRLLHELIKIDLEYRWRRCQANGAKPAPRLEDYVAQLPELGPSSRLPLDLISEEYRVRQRWGDRPGYRDYAERFGGSPALREALAQVAVQLESEQLARAVEPPARRLGRYELGERIGTGAFGSVWRAHDSQLGRTVAIKVPHQATVAQPMAERFLREARAAAQLRHPGIVAIHDFGRHDDTLYIVSEFIDGVSLADWMQERCHDPRAAAELITAVAEALDHAHRQGVIHRDVKPSNILLDRAAGPAVGVPKITDFGLALHSLDEATLTVEGQVLGTPAYMSPEQIRAPHAVDGRSDVYSLGVILYELLTGELPFQGLTRLLLVQVASDEPRPPRQLNPWIPLDLETICLTCLVKDPSRRYRTAAALAADLRRWLDGEPILARPCSRLERCGRWTLRHPARVLAAILCVVILVTNTGAPVAAFLVSLAIAAVGFALHKTRAAATLAEVVEEFGESRHKLMAMVQYALRHYDEARRERDRARSATAQATRRLAHGRELVRILLCDEMDEAAPSPRVLQAVRAYLDGLSHDAGDDPLVLRELALGYGRLADLQARTEPTDAAAHFQKSVALLETLAHAHPHNAQAQRDLRLAQDKLDQFLRRRRV